MNLLFILSRLSYLTRILPLFGVFLASPSWASCQISNHNSLVAARCNVTEAVQVYDDCVVGKALRSVCIQRLGSRLRELMQLDAEFDYLNAERDPTGSRKSDIQSRRAAAWLHLWAVYHDLIQRGINYNSPGGSTKLLSAGTDQPLALLLATYNQIALRATRPSYPLQLAMEERKLGFFSKHWPQNDHQQSKIPTSAELVGLPNDRFGKPSATSYNGLTLFKLLNLQLDRLFADGGESSEHVRSWLQDLRGTRVLASAFLADSGANAMGGSAFDAVLDRYAHYVSFRQDYATDTSLAKLIKEVKESLAKSGPISNPPGFQKLLDAAKPVLVNGKPQHLVEAQVWIRYLLLLALVEDQSANLRLYSAAPGILADQWKRLGLAESYDGFEGCLKTDDSGMFSRWDQNPACETASAAASDLSALTYNYIKFVGAKESMAKQQFESAYSTDTSATSRHVEALRSALEQLDMASKNFAFTWEGTTSDALRPRAPVVKGGSAEECTRMEGDLAAIIDVINGTRRVHRLQIDLNTIAKGEGAAALTGHALSEMRGHPLLSRSPYAMPNKTFNQYKDDLGHALNRLKDTMDDAEQRHQRQLLVDNYNNKQEALRASRHEQLAYELGTRVSKLGIAYAEKLSTMAKLGVEAELLGVEFSEAMKLAGEDEKKRAKLRLEYSTRVRDLAAARLDALEQAAIQAEKIAEVAIQDLEGAKGSIKAAITQIKDRQEAAARRQSLEVAKAVVNVVLAVAAPFTGGASLAYAQTATRMIELADQISTGQPIDVGNALEVLASVSPEVANVKARVENWGNNLTRDVLKTGQRYLAGAKQLENSLKDLDKAARDKFQRETALLTASLKAVPKYAERVVLASAMASGFPLQVKSDASGTSLGLDQGAAVKLTTELKIVSALNELHAAGGILRNDLEFRSKQVGELGALIDAAITDLPDDLRQEVTGRLDARDAKRRLDAAAAGLKAALETAPAEAEKFSLALQQGLLIVPTADGILAIDRKITAETAAINQKMLAFQGRLQREGKQAGTAAIKSLLENMQNISAVLSADITRATQEENIGVLNDLLDDKSRNGVDARIDDVRKAVEDLSNEIQQAKGVLDDRQDEATIASYESSAAESVARAAEARLKQSMKRVEMAKAGEEAQDLFVEQMRAKSQMSEELLLAGEARLSIASREAVTAARACWTHGIDCENPQPDVTRPQGIPAASARAWIVEYNMAGHAKTGVVEAADALVGMIQWVRLLAPGKDATTSCSKVPQGAYSALLDILAKPDIATEVRKSLENLSTACIKPTFDNLARQVEVYAPSSNINADRVYLFDGPFQQLCEARPVRHTGASTPSIDQTLVRSQLCKQVEGELEKFNSVDSNSLKEQLVGGFLFQRDLKSTPPLLEDLAAASDIIGKGTMAYVANLAQPRFLCRRCPNNTKFMVLPPPLLAGPGDIPGPYMHPGWGLSAEADADWQVRRFDSRKVKVLRNSIDFNAKKNMESALLGEGGNKWVGSGALGTWTVLILTTDVRNRHKRVKEIKRALSGDQPASIAIDALEVPILAVPN